MLRFIAIMLLGSATAIASAQSVYRCKTAQGTVYSQTPCDDQAERHVVKNAAPASSARPTGPFVDISEDSIDLLNAREDDIIARWGEPAVRYNKGDEQRWLYPNLGEVHDGQRVLVELHLEDGVSYQITYIPESVMAKSLQAARLIGDWRPPAQPPRRNFYATGDDPRGISKSAVISRFGQPDLKKVFNGIEVWEYHNIPMAADNPSTLTVYLEFDGDRVSQSIGN